MKTLLVALSVLVALGALALANAVIETLAHLPIGIGH